MTTRPILFSAPMVLALLDGRKTQTRRVAKPQPPDSRYELATLADSTARGDRKNIGKQHWLLRDGLNVLDSQQPYFSPPYGKPGDQLWVRENGWERPERSARDMREGADTWAPYYYDADGYNNDADREQFRAWKFKRRPSIHMPRWASRITLEITGVRVERLQEISNADVVAEGCEKHTTDDSFTFGKKTVTGYSGTGDGVFSFEPKHSYQRLWESINGPESWAANPLVWVIEFHRVKP